MKNLDQDLQEVYDQKMLREKIIIHVAGLKNRLRKQMKTLAILEIQINNSGDAIEVLAKLTKH